MSDQGDSGHVGLQPGEFVADAEVGQELGSGAGVSVFHATRDDGTEATVIGPASGVSQATCDRFISSASELTSRITTAIDNVAIPSVIDPLAFAVVVDHASTGTMADLPALGWDDQQKIAFLEKLALAVANLHKEGLVHGCLCPEAILLDDQNNPHVANVQGIDIAAEYREASPLTRGLAPYAASELRYGRNPTTQSDVFSVGRLMHFLFLGETPDEPDQAIPTLDSLRDAPPGMVMIIRKCTVNDFNDRYWDADGIYEEFARYHNNEAVGMREKGDDAGGPRVAKRDEAAERLLRQDKIREEGGAPLKSTSTYRPPGQDEKKGFNAGAAIVGVLAAAVFIGGSIAGSKVVGKGLHWLIVSLVGALFLPLLVPSTIKNARMVRALVATLGMAVLVFVDPTGALEKPQSEPLARLKAPTVAERVAALKELRADGETFFLQNDFSEGDLSGMDLKDTLLDGCIFVNAKLVGTDLSGASLFNADLGGADLSGANLTGLNPQFVKRWPEAKCNESTTMPDGWMCSQKGEPTAVEAKKK